MKGKNPKSSRNFGDFPEFLWNATKTKWTSEEKKCNCCTKGALCPAKKYGKAADHDGKSDGSKN